MSEGIHFSRFQDVSGGAFFGPPKRYVMKLKKTMATITSTASSLIVPSSRPGRCVQRTIVGVAYESTPSSFHTVVATAGSDLAGRQGDDQWLTIVKWTHFAIIARKELGISGSQRPACARREAVASMSLG